MSTMRAMLVSLAIPFLTAAANAAEPGWYVGAAYVDASMDIGGLDGVDAHSTGDDGGFKLIAGYQALEWLAFEANYSDLGKVDGFLDIVCIPEEECPGDFHLETRTLTVAALASVGIGPVDLFARAGFSSWTTDATFAAPDTSEQLDGTDPAYGIGIRVNLRTLALRLEFEHQELDANSVDLISLGATYTFGR